MKRTIIFLIATSFTLCHLHAQDEFKKSIDGSATEMTVKISNLSARLEIIGHNSNEVIISSSDYEGIPEKAKGLKPLSAYGEDNTSIGLYFNIENGIVEISGASRAANDGEYEIRLPRNIKLEIKSEDWNGDDIRVKGMQNEIDIKANAGDLELEDVSGPLVLNSMNGEIEVTLSNLNQDNPTSIKSTNGDIDISMPSDAKVDFRLSSLNGEIYTDLDLDFDGEKGDMRRMAGGMKANAKLNGGGIDFTIYALNGNVYLRQSK
jgi:lia operon protein LiaG